MWDLPAVTFADLVWALLVLVSISEGVDGVWIAAAAAVLPLVCLVSIILCKYI